MQELYKTLDSSSGITMNGIVRRIPVRTRGPSQYLPSECSNERDFSYSIGAAR
jgi:hypothetical protein